MTPEAVNGKTKKEKKVRREIAAAEGRRPAETAVVRADIASALVAARTAAGLTQIDVSKALDRPRSWIGKLETARRSLLFSEALQLADLYGTEVDDLAPPSGR